MSGKKCKWTEFTLREKEILDDMKNEANQSKLAREISKKLDAENQNKRHSEQEGYYWGSHWSRSFLKMLKAKAGAWPKARWRGAHVTKASKRTVGLINGKVMKLAELIHILGFLAFFTNPC